MYFVQIKPNKNRDINNTLIETTLDLLYKKKLDPWSSSVEELIDSLDDIVVLHNNNNPIYFINNFFNGSESQQNYDIISYDLNYYNNDQYYIMLTNKNTNSTEYINNLSEDDKQSKFNLIGSSLTKYHCNSVALFDDVFVMCISKPFIDLLNKMEDTNIFNDVDFSKIYFDFKLYNLIESFANINYVKIYSKPDNSTFYYNRCVIDELVINNKYELLERGIIKLEYKDKTIYIRRHDILPGSHYNIMNSIKDQRNDTNNYYYYGNLSDNDIIYINNL